MPICGWSLKTSPDLFSASTHSITMPLACRNSSREKIMGNIIFRSQSTPARKMALICWVKISLYFNENLMERRPRKAIACFRRLPVGGYFVAADIESAERDVFRRSALSEFPVNKILFFFSGEILSDDERKLGAVQSYSVAGQAALSRSRSFNKLTFAISFMRTPSFVSVIGLHGSRRFDRRLFFDTVFEIPARYSWPG